MARTGRSLQALAAEIERRAGAKEDLIAPVSKLHFDVVENKPALIVQNGEERMLHVNDLAHSQIGEYLGIPAAYYRRMREEAPDLLVQNANRWLGTKHDLDEVTGEKIHQRRLLRCLDGNVRALLSDKYRSLDYEDLAEVVLPILLDRNLIILACEITERRLYIKAVDQRILRDVPTGRSLGDGSHEFFDTCSPAVTISDSEVGYGALSIETGVYTRACTNLAMIGTNMRKFHTGSRASISDEVYALLTDDTKKTTDAAVWKQTRDILLSAFDEKQFTILTDKLTGAAKDRIDPKADVVQVVKRAAKRFSFTEQEGSSVLQRLIQGGDLTRYGLHAAITNASQDAEVFNFDRATEFERIGGDVIDMQPNEWRELAAA
jgi:hypothetical protein